MHPPMEVRRLPIGIQDVALSLYVKKENVVNVMHGRDSKAPVSEGTRILHDRPCQRRDNMIPTSSGRLSGG